MRCLALAQAWKDAGGKVHFVIGMKTPALMDRLVSEGIDVISISEKPGSMDDANHTAYLAADSGSKWVVVDGYFFGSDYQKTIKESGLHLLFIDDNGHADHYYADIVLNQNLHATEKLYHNREPYTKLLLGPKYVLLRREFWPWRGWKREIPKVARNILVTLGGSDPEKVTHKVIQALQQIEIDELEALVVIGAGNYQYEGLNKLLEHSKYNIRLQSNVLDMPNLMAWADIAISAGGSTAWELAFMGLPSIILVIAENQISVADRLGKDGFAINLGWHKDIKSAEISINIKNLLDNFNYRSEISNAVKELVDGEGAPRITEIMQNKQKITLKKGNEESCRLLWEWANDPSVRISSFSPNLIKWEDHKKWFSMKSNDPNCFIFIANDNNGIPIGQIRFDIQNEDAEIDVSIDRNYRNSAYGSMLIDEGIKELFKIKPVRKFHAYIKPENRRSLRAFEKSGFKRSDITEVKGNLSIHLLLIKSEE